MSAKVHLVVIDGQYDFADKRGALYVPEGEIAVDQNLPALIRRLGREIDDISLTMDSHTRVHIAHAVSWKGGAAVAHKYPNKRPGDRPDPFTVISVDDVKGRIWDYAIPGQSSWGLEYVEALAAGGRYVLTIWPTHCLIGTLGATFMPNLEAAVGEWETSCPAVANRVAKGSNYLTEHYSAVKADVPRDDDPSTQMNIEFIRMLVEADEVLIAGLATTHCVANTFRDVAAEFDPDAIKKLVFLEDCCRGIVGPPGNDAGSVAARAMFREMEDSFLRDMTAMGMRISNSRDYRPGLVTV